MIKNRTTLYLPPIFLNVCVYLKSHEYSDCIISRKSSTNIVSDVVLREENPLDKESSGRKRLEKSGNRSGITIRKKTRLVGKLPGLVVNIEDSQSESWSLDVSSIPGFV
jgi:hypothetical protein